MCKLTINFLKKCSRSYSEIKNELFKNLFKLLGISSSFYAIFELFLCNFLCNTAFFRRLRHEWGAVKLFYNLNMFLSESLDSGGKFCAFLHSKSIKHVTCKICVSFHGRLYFGCLIYNMRKIKIVPSKSTKNTPLDKKYIKTLSKIIS